jgi:predicted ribosome quality control (RQC) complex YloA/Tae2 family protein
MRYDSLLVRHLAAELNQRCAGRPVHGIELAPETQRLIIDVDDVRLQWNLHPASGYLGVTPALLPLEHPIQLPRRSRWKRSHAMFDERVLIVELSGEARPHSTMKVIVELLTNQWNVITLDADEKVLRQLKTRTASTRDIRRGQVYQPPQSIEPRTTASAGEWLQIFDKAEPRERTKIFLARFVYASPLNADAVFAASDLSAAYDRYQELVRTVAPHIVSIEEARLPYSHSLWQRTAERVDSLLEASGKLGGSDVAEDVAAEIARRLYALDRKLERLAQELDAAGTRANAIRSQADVLMAYASTITRGARRVTLPDFEGNQVTIELDPALSPIDNAQALYQEARKQQRASERLPKLVQAAQRSREDLLALNERAQKGTLTPGDMRGLVRKPPQQKQRAGSTTEKLPYRRYRTSGGLEVRVGRNSRANDELTLHHSSPRDVWMHARHVGGAHVVLRWQDQDANPPMKDLMEAAALAAIHSRARTSRTVPVDYTRKKYVTKRRKSPPGQVIMERGKTLFVEPSAELEERLRWPEDEA